jgi:hypothetical protein
MPRIRTLRESLATAADAASESFGDDGIKDNAGAATARRGILVRVSPSMWRELKLAAIERGVTVQSILLAAITDELRRPNSSQPTP